MIIMILKMLSIIAVHVLLTVFLWKKNQSKVMGMSQKLMIGFIYGLFAIFSNHFGVVYEHSILNIRDLSPLTAGLLFDPLSGIIAGFIGGIERYIIGRYFNIGYYTHAACSIATITSGFLAAFLNCFLLRGKKPSAAYAFFIGAVMEVFHMYEIFLTHRRDMLNALSAIKNNSAPMIFFTAFGLMAEIMILRFYAGEWTTPFKKIPKENIEISKKFNFWLSTATLSVLFFTFIFSFMIRTQTAIEIARNTLRRSLLDITTQHRHFQNDKALLGSIDIHVGSSGSFDIIRDDLFVAGAHNTLPVSQKIRDIIELHEDNNFFRVEYFDTDSFCVIKHLDNGDIVFLTLPLKEIYNNRDTMAYETIFANIITMAVLFMLVSLLVQNIIVKNLSQVNSSLRKIADGNLQEEVSVYESTEFATLSEDINSMVSTLKGYIEAAEKRIRQELLFAKTVQESSIPRNFRFDRTDFEIYASMKPAKQVGGDFYDFFFIGQDRLVLVIADVSGKGIPAALFMMKSKAALRSLAGEGNSPAEVMNKLNLTLAEDNRVKMFVTVWLGIIDLKTGIMKCSNAGHEYPLLKRKNTGYEYYKDSHNLVLGLRKKINFTDYEIRLESGDDIFIYTDGIPESFNGEDEVYGFERLKNVLTLNSDKSAKEIVENLVSDLDDFVGNAEQFDDTTMLVFKYKA
ncbi:SpoIIE family protein phosphatase [Lachnospiraceae bacterium C1.1]|nr:SpoIIE family protein phosphatase [Lachnospiraceae bacterium C1.1]